VCEQVQTLKKEDSANNNPTEALPSVTDRCSLSTHTGCVAALSFSLLGVLQQRQKVKYDELKVTASASAMLLEALAKNRHDTCYWG
jgi:hypothetical protein